MSEDLNRERSELGELLIHLRKKHGELSQRGLARATKVVGKTVSEPMIGAIETGDRNASMETLEAFRAAMALPPTDFLALVKAAGHSPPGLVLPDDVQANVEKVAARLAGMAYANDVLEMPAEFVRNVSESLVEISDRLNELLQRLDELQGSSADVRQAEPPPASSSTEDHR